MMYLKGYIGKAVEIEDHSGEFYHGIVDSVAPNYIFLIPNQSSTTFTPIIPLREIKSISEFPYFFF